MGYIKYKNHINQKAGHLLHYCHLRWKSRQVKYFSPQIAFTKAMLEKVISWISLTVPCFFGCLGVLETVTFSVTLKSIVQFWERNMSTLKLGSNEHIPLAWEMHCKHRIAKVTLCQVISKRAGLAAWTDTSVGWIMPHYWVDALGAGIVWLRVQDRVWGLRC